MWLPVMLFTLGCALTGWSAGKMVKKHLNVENKDA